MKKQGPGRTAGIFSLIFIYLNSAVLLPLFYISNAQASATAAASAAAGAANSSTGGFIPSNFYQTQPPAYSNAAATQSVNIFSSCTNMSLPLQTIMQGAASGSAMGAVCSAIASGVTPFTICPGNDQSPLGEQGVMGMMGIGMGMGGGMSCPANPKGIENQFDMAYCAAMCKYGVEQAKQQELQCLTAKANELSQMLGSLATEFTSNIQAMQKDVQTIKAALDDRKNQLSDVEFQLNGDPGSGKPGLLAQQAATQAEIGTLQDAFKSLQQAQQQAVQAQQVLDEQIQTRVMAETMNCFTTDPIPGQTCTQNGPPQDSKDYAICRYGENLQLGKGNQIERSAVQGAQATGSQDSLTSVLTNLVSDAPTMDNATIVPVTDAQGLADAASKTAVSVLSISDVINRYGSQLSAYKIGATDMGAYVSGALSYCYQRAEQTEANEEARTDSGQGQGRIAIQQLQQTNSTVATKTLNTASDVFASDMNSLTGSNIPPNTSACVGAPPQIQLGCVQNMQASLTHVLRGDTSSTAVVGSIKGNNPSTAIPLSYSGINGGVAEMQTVDRNIKADQANLQNFETQYVANANRATVAAAHTEAAALSPQIANVVNSLKMMGVTVPPVQGEQLQPDGDGLDLPPNNTTNFVGQFTNPPMPDMSGDAFSQAINQSKQAQQAANQQLAQIQSQKFQFEAMIAHCSQSGNSGAALQVNLQVAANVADAITNANCGTELNAAECMDKYSKLMEVMDDIQGSTQQHAMTLTALRTGLASICDTSQRKTGENTKKANTKQGCLIGFNNLKSALSAAAGASKQGGESAGSANSGANGMMQNMMMQQMMNNQGH